MSSSDFSEALILDKVILCWCAAGQTILSWILCMIALFFLCKARRCFALMRASLWSTTDGKASWTVTGCQTHWKSTKPDTLWTPWPIYCPTPRQKILKLRLNSSHLDSQQAKRWSHHQVLCELHTLYLDLSCSHQLSWNYHLSCGHCVSCRLAVAIDSFISISAASTPL